MLKIGLKKKASKNDDEDFEESIEERQKKERESKKIKLKELECEFIPHACLINENTAITKNGELIQVIKISSDEVKNLKVQLIEFLQSEENLEEHAVWIHCIRNQKGIKFSPLYQHAFSKDVSEEFLAGVELHKNFTNETFISVVSDSVKIPQDIKNNFLYGLDPKILHKFHDRKIEEKLAKLNKLTHDLQKSFQKHQIQARFLGVNLVSFEGEPEEIACSELLSFLNRLTNFEERPVPMPEISFDNVLTGKNLYAFGYNVFQIKDKQTHNSICVGCTFTVKNCPALTDETVSKILSLKQNITISEAIDFTEAKGAIQNYKFLKRILSLSQDQETAQALDVDLGGRIPKNKFFSRQLMVTISSKDMEVFEEDCEVFVKMAKGLGIVLVREDIRLLDSVMASLPGNFFYLNRLEKAFVNTIGNFCLSTPVEVQAQGAKTPWQQPLTIIHNQLREPLVFKWQESEEALQAFTHSAVIGNYSATVNAVSNFLLTQSFREQMAERVIIIDATPSSKAICKALGGSYYKISTDPKLHNCHLNPISIGANVDSSYSFMTSLFDLLGKYSRFGQLQQEQQFLPTICKVIAAYKEKGLTNFSQVATLMEKANSSIFRKFSAWFGSGKWGHIFSSTNKDVFDGNSSSVMVFDLSDVINEEFVLPAVMLYLQSKIEQTLTGAPTIIVYKEAWTHYLKQEGVRGSIQAHLKNLSKKNAFAIFCASSIAQINASPTAKTFWTSLGSAFFLANPNADVTYKKDLFCSQKEIDDIINLPYDDAKFILKRPQKASSVMSLRIASLSTKIPILTGDTNCDKLIDLIIEESGSHLPQDWLKTFYTRLVELAKKEEEESKEDKEMLEELMLDDEGEEEGESGGG